MVSESVTLHTEMSRHQHKSFGRVGKNAPKLVLAKVSLNTVPFHQSMRTCPFFDIVRTRALSSWAPWPVRKALPEHCLRIPKGKFLSWLCLQSSCFWPSLWSFGSCSTQLLQPDELFDLWFFWVDLTGLLINFLPLIVPYKPCWLPSRIPSHTCRL